MIVNAFDVRHDVIVNRCVVIGVSRFLRVNARNEEQGSDERAREAILEHGVFLSVRVFLNDDAVTCFSLCKKCHVYKREAKNYSTIYAFI